jgi:hypothetical protein
MNEYIRSSAFLTDETETFFLVKSFDGCFDFITHWKFLLSIYFFYLPRFHTTGLKVDLY